MPKPSPDSFSDGVPAWGDAPADAWGVPAKIAGVEGAEVWAEDKLELVMLF